MGTLIPVVAQGLKEKIVKQIKSYRESGAKLIGVCPVFSPSGVPYWVHVRPLSKFEDLKEIEQFATEKTPDNMLHYIANVVSNQMLCKEEALKYV